MDCKNDVMKKIVLYIFVIAAFSSVGAQSHKLQIGAIGGVDSYFQPQEDALSNYHYEYGWSSGISIQHNFMKRFSLHYRFMYREEIKTETIYPETMGDIIYTNTDLLEKRTITDQFMVVPVLAKWTFGQQKLHWMVDIGMQLQMPFEKVSDNLNLGLTSGLGISYDFTDRMAVETEFRIGEFDKQNGYSYQGLIGLSYGIGQK